MQSCENGLVRILRAAAGVADDTDNADVCKFWMRHAPLPRYTDDVSC